MSRRSIRRTAASSAVAALLVAGSASAQYRGGYDREYDFARVVRVDPIIDVTERPVSREQCWEERVSYREEPRYHGSRGERAPAVLAGIVGGVIGNQFGSGRGRDAATAAGAALGYSLARDSQRRYRGGHYHEGREISRYEPRCETRTEYAREEQVTGYEVTYRYLGRTYRTVTDYHPGDRIRVEVDMDVRPAR